MESLPDDINGFHPTVSQIVFKLTNLNSNVKFDLKHYASDRCVCISSNGYVTTRLGHFISFIVSQRPTLFVFVKGNLYHFFSPSGFDELISILFLKLSAYLVSLTGLSEIANMKIDIVNIHGSTKINFLMNISQLNKTFKEYFTSPGDCQLLQTDENHISFHFYQLGYIKIIGKSVTVICKLPENYLKIKERFSEFLSFYSQSTPKTSETL